MKRDRFREEPPRSPLPAPTLTPPTATCPLRPVPALSTVYSRSQTVVSPGARVTSRSPYSGRARFVVSHPSRCPTCMGPPPFVATSGPVDGAGFHCGLPVAVPLASATARPYVDSSGSGRSPQLCDVAGS